MWPIKPKCFAFQFCFVELSVSAKINDINNGWNGWFSDLAWIVDFQILLDPTSIDIGTAHNTTPNQGMPFRTKYFITTFTVMMHCFDVQPSNQNWPITEIELHMYSEPSQNIIPHANPERENLRPSKKRCTFWSVALTECSVHVLSSLEFRILYINVHCPMMVEGILRCFDSATSVVHGSCTTGNILWQWDRYSRAKTFFFWYITESQCAC